MKDRAILASPDHEIAYADLCALVAKHADKVSAEELLAIASNMVGKLVAMQDQRTMSSSRAMLTVSKNLGRGNEQVIEQLLSSKGSS